MKKTLIVILLFILAPFLMLVPIIGAASAVGGFYDPDSGDDFDIETFGTSEVVQTVKGWYEEYISECATALDDRKKAVEKEHTTIETVDKPSQPTETEPEMTAPTETQPEMATGEPETEQREVCHVNVITTMDDFPLSAVLAYYNTLFTRYNSSKLPEKDDIRDMLTVMIDYSEHEADDGSENYYITMDFKPYQNLPDVIFQEWELSDEERSEYTEMYLNMTELVSGWLDEDLGSFINEEAVHG